MGICPPAGGEKWSGTEWASEKAEMGARMKTEISLVVCTFNSTNSLLITLSVNRGLGLREIIVVDGFSTDGIERIHELQGEGDAEIRLFQVPKQGIGHARAFGTSQASGKYVLHAGPDNWFTDETLSSMLAALERYDLVSCTTETVSERAGYLSRAHKIYKRRFSAGETDVVGTPYIARRPLFDQFPFKPEITDCDDTELCMRLVRGEKRIFRVSEACYEVGFDDLASIGERWIRWGRSDAQFYLLMSPDWSWRRRLRSVLHPISTEIGRHFRLLSLGNFIKILPFLLLVVSVRYVGWASYFVSTKRR